MLLIIIRRGIISQNQKYSEQLTNDFISEGHDEEAAEKLSKAVYLPVCTGQK